MAAGAAIVTSIGALRGSYGWGLTTFFAVLAAILYVLPLLGSRRFETVQVDEAGVHVETDKGRDQVLWVDLMRVRIVTTDGGPLSEDVFFVLDDAAGKGCVVPHDAVIRTKLLEELQSRLQGVDNKKVIEAMGCTNNHTFVIWEKSVVAA